MGEIHTVKGLDKILKVGQTLTLEDMFKVSYKGKLLDYEDLSYHQITDFDLNNLKKGKNRVYIEVSYKGMKQTVSSLINVKTSLFDEEEKPKIKQPMLRLNPSFVYKDYVDLYPATKFVSMQTLQPAFIIQKEPIEELLEEPIEEDNSMSEQKENTYDQTLPKNNHQENKPVKKEDKKEDALNEMHLTSIEMIDILDITQHSVPFEIIREDLVIMNESQDNEKMNDDNASLNNKNMVLIASSFVGVVFIFILIIILYVNKKRKEKDNQ